MSVSISERLVNLVKNEPALVRNVIFGGITLLAAHWKWLDNTVWLDGIATAALFLFSGYLIRRNVTPTSKIDRALSNITADEN